MLSLPRTLADAYTNRVTDLGLSATADDCRALGSGEIGGISEEESDRHFCGRFPNSAARTQFALLDPASALGDLPDKLLQAFLMGKIAVIDLPSGSGAGVWGVLSAIATLRRERVIPRPPIQIQIFGGDISTYANTHNIGLSDAVRQSFAELDMHIELRCSLWDATDSRSTAMLMDLVAPFLQDVDITLVCISNFSGEMQNDEFRQKVETNLTQVVSRVAGQPHAVIWVESASKTAKKFLPKVILFFQRHLPWLSLGDSADVSQAFYSVCDPWNGATFQTGLSVVKFEPGALAWKGLRG